VDRQGFLYHSKHQRKAGTHIGDAHVNVEKCPRHGGIKTEDATNLTSNGSVYYQHQHSARAVGGTSCQDRPTNRVARGQAMMFVLGTYWVWNAPHDMF